MPWPFAFGRPPVRPPEQKHLKGLVSNENKSVFAIHKLFKIILWSLTSVLKTLNFAKHDKRVSLSSGPREGLLTIRYATLPYATVFVKQFAGKIVIAGN